MLWGRPIPWESPVDDDEAVPASVQMCWYEVQYDGPDGMCDRVAIRRIKIKGKNCKVPKRPVCDSCFTWLMEQSNGVTDLGPIAMPEEGGLNPVQLRRCVCPWCQGCCRR